MSQSATQEPLEWAKVLDPVVVDAKRCLAELTYLAETRQTLIAFQSAHPEAESTERRFAITSAVTSIFVSQQLWTAAAYWRVVQSAMSRNTYVEYYIPVVVSTAHLDVALIIAFFAFVTLRLETLPIDGASAVVGQFHAIIRFLQPVHDMVEHNAVAMLAESMDGMLSAMPIIKLLATSPLQPWHWIQLASSVGSVAAPSRVVRVVC